VNETLPHVAGGESERVRQARSLASRRHVSRRTRLRPLGWALLAVVIVSTANAHPAPGTGGTRLGVTVALIVYCAALLLELRPDWPTHAPAVTIATTALLGASGIALAALQPRGAAELAPSVAVWLAATRLRRPASIAVAAAVTVGLAITIALTADGWREPAAATVLLCILLFFTGELTRRAHEGEERTELLLAELEDARDAQTEAAALAERSRIARELHDVLAHTLSALTIRLEGARLLAVRDGAGSELSAAIGSARELARSGLDEAKQAVSALRSDAAPTAADLQALVDGFREVGLNVTLEVLGTKRTLPVSTGAALYRAAQEALTNALRYAPGSRTAVRLDYRDDRVTLSVEDDGGTGETLSPLEGAGGGRGLAGMRERVEAVGGRVSAGPAGTGFRVEIEAPA
jgi:signal transduction histidine kinase